MKTRHIALALCCILAVPADTIAARAGWVTKQVGPDLPVAEKAAPTEAAPEKVVPQQTPRPEASKLPHGTPEQIAEEMSVRVSATMIALNKFVDDGACPGSKFDPVGAATRLSESKIKTDDVDQAKVKNLADQQLAFYRGMDAKRACSIIIAEFGPTGTAMPDVVVSAK